MDGREHLKELDVNGSTLKVMFEAVDCIFVVQKIVH
jgi:hypothetical protein